MGFWTKERTGEERVDYIPKLRWGRVSAAAAGGLLALSLGTCGWKVVPAGHVGVQSLMGNVYEQEFQPGFNVKNPFVHIIPMTTRTRQVKEDLDVPTSEGMTAGLEVSVLYHIKPQHADSVYKSLGDDKEYEINVVQPLVRSTVRDVVASYKAEDLYTAKRAQVTQSMTTRLGTEFTNRSLVLEQVLIRDLDLPKKLTAAIEEKMEAEQQSLRMTYVLDRERKEADRRTIEARGIADAQRIISGSLTAPYLQWHYITALKELVDGPNNTTIVLPYDQKLTPMLQVPTGPPRTAQR